MLEFLKKYYYQKDKVKKIIELGDCSILAEKLEPTKKGHSFNNPEENVSIFYGRDRNETNVKAIDFKNRDELIKQAKDSWADDCYIYNKEQGRWDIL
ncbi:hypothetical protein IV53_GL000692 [Ligilactobacillus ceti DSM 22408]|uniref:Uncharacterized protein n=2 Tax=Ligilactobacillus TaxID=2767887 RepID=A0A0R2KRH4_9LACO|nr:hypothetical protein IV53_GL000692 [Ligilactobacillus ceti DSM 22408]